MSYVVFLQDLGLTPSRQRSMLDAAGCRCDSLTRDAAIAAGVEDQVEILVTSRHHVGAAELAPWPNLRMVSCAFTGVDGVNRAALLRRHVQAYYVPGYATPSVCELAVGLTLAVLRRIPQADIGMRFGDWDQSVVPGRELSGTTVGIIGTGTIGIETAKLFRAFGCNVLGWSRTPRKKFKALGGHYKRDLDALLRESQIVSLHIPASGSTERLLNARRIRQMRPDAILINTSRGRLVDEDALADALREGRIAGAGIDVFVEEPMTNSPLLTSRNVVLTPHVGFKTGAALERLAEGAIANIGRYIVGSTLNRLVLLSPGRRRPTARVSR